MQEKLYLNLFISKIHNMGIDTPNIAEDSNLSDLFWAPMISYSHRFQEIKNILTDSNLSTLEQQARLERLDYRFKREKGDMSSTVPLKLVPFIERLNRYTSGRSLKEHTSSFLVQAYSPHRPAAGKKAVATYKPRSEKQVFLVGYNNLLKIMDYINVDFGSTTMFFMSQACKKHRSLSKDDLKSIYAYDEMTRKGEVIDPANHVLVVRTKILGDTAKSLVDCIPSFCQTALDCIMLKKEKQINLSPEEMELDGVLKNKSTWWNPSEKDMGMLVGQLATYLEMSQVVSPKFIKWGQFLDNTKNVYLFEKSIFSALMSLPMSTPKLPMLTVPRKWECAKNTHPSKGMLVNIHSGGYSANLDQLYSGVIANNKALIVNVTEQEVDNINYLQSVPFKVNSVLVDTLLQGAAGPVFYAYMNETAEIRPPLQTFPQALILENNRGKLLTIEQFMGEDTLLCKLLTKLNSLSDPKSRADLQIKIKSRKIDLDIDYQNQIINFLDLVFTVAVAELYKQRIHYYPITIDFRGRAYYSAYPFGPQTNNLGEAIIDISYSSPLPLDNNSYKVATKNYFATQKQTPRNIFFCLKKNIDPVPNQIRLNVSCSGYQILSGLLGHPSGLLSSNLIVDSITVGKELKKDYYDEFLQCFLRNYPMVDFYPQIKSWSDLDLNISESDIKDDTPFDFNMTTHIISNAITTLNIKKGNVSIHESIKDILIAFKSYFNRDSMKDWVMCLIYSEGNRSRALKLLSFYDSHRYLFPIIYQDNVRLLVYKVAYGIADCFQKQFYNHNPHVDKFGKILYKQMLNKNVLKQNNGIWLCSSHEAQETLFCEHAYEDKRFEYKNSFNKRVQFVFRITTGEIDVKAFRHSLMANFIHYLDSRILHNVISQCAQNGILLYVNHTSFYVHPKHSQKIKEFYFLAFKKVILNNDTLTYFFHRNGADFGNHGDFIAEINKNKDRIMSFLITGNYVMSPYILS